MEGYGHIIGLKSAHLACSGGMIKAAAHPVLAPFKHSFSGVQWTSSDGCGVARRDCLLTICGEIAAVLESATVAHVNVSTLAQSLVCLGGHSNVTFQRASFHGNTAGCISVPQQPPNATVRLHINNCNFTNNHAPVDVGGVLELAGGTALVEASNFSGNSARANGGAIGVTNDARLTLVSSLLQNNTGKRHGSVN
jgi:predicted outer membrane repeat protein